MPWQNRQLPHNAKGAVNSGPPPFRNLYLGLFDLVMLKNPSQYEISGLQFICLLPLQLSQMIFRLD
jgi:hypothetical protein